jgi:serine/threonine protein phosphatase PrpC
MQVQTGLRAAGMTHPGLVREVNEDRYHYDAARGVFLVVDGLGGQAAGEKAAETALALVRTRLERETGSVEDRVREAISLANDEIFRLASLKPEWKGMACVLTAAVVHNGDVVVGHVGDSRLYKFRDGRMEKLTRDHSPIGEREDAGELSEAEAMRHPRRSEVYRDVGSGRHDPDEPGFIDVIRRPFEADAALLLCSDGLTDLVPAAAIADTVRESAGQPQDTARALVGAAIDAGGKDNVTVVYVEGPAFAASLPHQAPLPPARGGRWRLAALVGLLAIVSVLAVYAQRDRFLPPVTLKPPIVNGPTVVRPGESIAAAVRAAASGGEVVVEPGEYRERIELQPGVRVVSRVARGAVLRLPAGASETDPAVTAVDADGAELSGFRILGDAATPLGSAVFVRNSAVVLSDLEIAGASRSAVEYAGGEGGSLVACYIHDNPGAAITVREGASPRIAHNAFLRNAGSDHAPAAVFVETGARPAISANTFYDLRPEAVLGTSDAAATAALARDNWFVSAARGRR